MKKGSCARNCLFSFKPIEENIKADSFSLKPPERIHQPIRQLLVASIEVIIVRASDKPVPLVFLLRFHRHLQPPAPGFVAFPKRQLVVVPFQIHDVFHQVVHRGREIVFADGEAVEEIPDELGEGLSGQVALVEVFFVAVKTDAGQFVAQACVAAELAGFFRKKAAGRGVGDAGRFDFFQGGQVKTHQVGVSQVRLHVGHVGFGFAEADAIEVAFFQFLEHRLVREMRLAADGGEVKQSGFILQNGVQIIAFHFALARVKSYFFIHHRQADRRLQRVVRLELRLHELARMTHHYRANPPLQQFPQQRNQERMLVLAHVAEVGDFQFSEGKTQRVQGSAHGIRLLLADADEGDLRVFQVGQFIFEALDFAAEAGLVEVEVGGEIGGDWSEPVFEHEFVFWGESKRRRAF